MAVTRRYSLCTMEVVFPVLVLFYMFNKTFCAEIITIPYGEIKAPLEKVKHNVVKTDPKALYEVEIKIPDIPAELEQILHPNIEGTDLLCCVVPNTNSEYKGYTVETHPTVQYNTPQEILLYHRKTKFLKSIAEIVDHVISKLILKIAHSLLNTFENHRPLPYLHHYQPHYPGRPHNDYHSALLNKLAHQIKQQKQYAESQLHNIHIEYYSQPQQHKQHFRPMSSRPQSQQHHFQPQQHHSQPEHHFQSPEHHSNPHLQSQGHHPQSQEHHVQTQKNHSQPQQYHPHPQQHHSQPLHPSESQHNRSQIHHDPLSQQPQHQDPLKQAGHQQPHHVNTDPVSHKSIHDELVLKNPKDYKCIFV